MILDLSTAALNPDGSVMLLTPGQPATLGYFTSQSLFAEKGAPDPVKFCAWAIELHKTGKIEVDKSDVQMLKTWITGFKGLAAGIHGPIKTAILALEK